MFVLLMVQAAATGSRIIDETECELGPKLRDWTKDQLECVARCKVPDVAGV